MDLQQLFPPERLLVGFHPADKWDAIERMLDHLEGSSGLSPEDLLEAREAVLNRERSMSTGMERGLAIPHAAVDGLDDVQAVLAVLSEPEGLNFESIDGSPTRLIVLLLVPRAKKLLHIRTLADVARVLGDERVQAALLAAGDVDEAWHALGES